MEEEKKEQVVEEEVKEEQSKEAQDLAEELKKLGGQLENTLRAAWGSVKQQEIHDEVEDNFETLQDSLKKAADAVSEKADELLRSEQAASLKSEVEDLRERVSSGEVTRKIQNEFVSTLRVLNEQLEKLANTWEPKKKEETEEETA